MWAHASDDPLLRLAKRCSEPRGQSLSATDAQDDANLPVLDLSLVTYNSSSWLDGFFKSLQDQELPLAQIRILVRDNGSSDDTLTHIRKWSEELGERCGGFQVEAGENVGFGRGHNRNLERARAPLFLVSNVDLSFEADALSRLVRAAEADAEQVASWEMRQKPYEHPKVYDPVSLETRWSSHACVLFRREALLAVGGYEERLFLYGEDVELSYRLRDAGYTLRYVPSAVCWHYTYQHPGEIKRAQWLGSKVANLLLRLRYGAGAQVLVAPFMYAALWLVPPRVPHYYRGLIAMGAQLARDAPHFLRTRRQSTAPFPFRGWDYEAVRSGAFYRLAEPLAAPPLVTLITRTMRGRENQLRQALQSIENQTYPNLELIVVEDGSSDARGLVEALAARARLVRAVHIAIPKSGRCLAGNRGLQEARGDLVGFLDDDDLLFADHVEVLAATLGAHPELGAAYGLAFEVRADAFSAGAFATGSMRYSPGPRQPFSRALLWDHNYLPIQAVLFRRNLYETYGGFDVELENLEDWNLWVRYSRFADFQMVERTTSLYTVPVAAARAFERFSALDGYALRARAKNALYQGGLNPAESAAYAAEITRYNTIWGLPRQALRRIALGLPFAGPMFHLLRRIGQVLTRRGTS